MTKEVQVTFGVWVNPDGKWYQYLPQNKLEDGPWQLYRVIAHLQCPEPACKIIKAHHVEKVESLYGGARGGGKGFTNYIQAQRQEEIDDDN